MDPNTTDLFAGLAGLSLAPARFDLGEGISISQTYAHFMAPFLMAFKPATPGKPHPAPWKPARGGIAIDITAELHVPMSFSPQRLDRLNTIWWIVALLRLRTSPALFVPVVSNEKLSSIEAIKEEPVLMPVEVTTHRVLPQSLPLVTMNDADLNWVKRHWFEGMALFENEDFAVAFQAFDSAAWNSNLSLGLVALWGALERMFATSNQELSFRVSANIAAFLEPPGRERYKSFKTVKEQYDHRSKAAHGSISKGQMEPFQCTYEIARRAFGKIIETNRVPSKKDLEALLFGDIPDPTIPSQAAH